MKGEGGLPVIKREKTEQGEKSDPQSSINDAFAMVAEAARKACESMRISSAFVRAEIENFKKKAEEMEKSER